MEKRREILSGIYLFKNLDNAVGQIELSAPVYFKKGERIYCENSYRKSIGVILSGKAVAKTSEGGILNYFTLGSVFGVAALFSENEQYVSCVSALTDCKVQFIEEEKIKEIFEKYPQSAINHINFLSSRVRFLNSRLSVMMKGGAEERLYAYLCGIADEKGDLPTLKMTVLAKTLCMGRTTLYRTFETLEEKNLIVRKDGKVSVIL